MSSLRPGFSSSASVLLYFGVVTSWTGFVSRLFRRHGDDCIRVWVIFCDPKVSVGYDARGIFEPKLDLMIDSKPVCCMKQLDVGGRADCGGEWLQSAPEQKFSCGLRAAYEQRPSEMSIYSLPLVS